MVTRVLVWTLQFASAAAICFWPTATHAEVDAALRLTASSAVPSLRVSDDLELDLLFEQPTIAKPIYLTFDERGRLWVVEYRQYPWPAGLKLLNRDSVWRNQYRPAFAPPPPHAADSPFRGLDRISIHEDSDRDGTLDRHKVFLDGLNLATAALPGRGGVFVLNPPYLLFYADRDRNDVPDDPKPQVLLSGFGFEDSHSLANSLRWGPDGWIYATQGSTVSSEIVVYDARGKRLADRPVVRSMGQNVWRYHPERRVYEIYAEGGGNSFGVEIDAAGRIYSGHNGGNTRGFHYVQGGYYLKNFAKHGQLSNPYAFAHLSPMRGNAAQRFSHMFCVYEADTLPARYRGMMFAANPLGHQLVLSEVSADGSSRRTRDVGFAVASGNGERSKWFTPIDVQIGPDGALYVADWYAEQTNHYYSHEGRTNPELGRVLRLRGDNALRSPVFDLAAESSATLVTTYLRHANRWFRQQALRVLADRRDDAVVPQLWEMLQASDGQDALEAFWGLYLCGGLSEQRFAACLGHGNPAVRRWSLHVLGDHPEWAPGARTQLLAMACGDEDAEVRCQLAATCKRLPSSLAVPLVFSMLRTGRDAADVYIPSFLWWSLESHANSFELVEQQLSEPAAWQAGIQADGNSTPQNLMRRYAGTGRERDLLRCARLLQLAPDKTWRDELIKAFAASVQGRQLPAFPQRLAEELAKSHGLYARLLAIRQGDAAAIAAAMRVITDGNEADDASIAMIHALGDVRADAHATIPLLLSVLERDRPNPVKAAALISLQKYSAPEIGTRLIGLWERLPKEVQAQAAHTLASRESWARELIDAVSRDAVDRPLIDANILNRLRRFNDEKLQQQIVELFPAANTSLSDREAQIESYVALFNEGQGSPVRGRELFHGRMMCGKCHLMFGEGGDIGPDLTSYNRSDAARLMLALVHPAAEIREGYEAYIVLTTDGRALSGFKIEDTDQVLVLRGADGQAQTVLKSEVEEVILQETSIMPDGLLNGFTDEELADLFAFLFSTTPPL